MNDKKGKNIVNDGFAHKPNGLLVYLVHIFNSPIVLKAQHLMMDFFLIS